MGQIISAVEFTGKFGNMVGYSNGKVRIRRKSVANPRSSAQSIQRMILATVGVAIAYLREICNNSVEGKKYGGETLAYLRGQWMRMLRVSNILDASNTYSYIARGSQLFANNPYMVSRGSLASISASLDSYANSAVVNGLGAASASVVASALFPMVAVGNQITVIAVSYDDGHDTPNWIFTKYCRFAFKDNTTPALIANTLNTEGGFLINPEAIDLTKAEGDWDKLVFKTTQGQIDLTYLNGDIATERGYDVIGCAIIQSNLVNGKRSTEYLSVSSSFTHLSASEAYSTFGNGGTVVDVPSEVYLNNSTTESSVGRGVKANFTFPISLQQLAGKTLEMLGGVTASDIVFSTDLSETNVTIVGGFLNDGADDYNMVTQVGNTLVFGSVPGEVGPNLTGVTY